MNKYKNNYNLEDEDIRYFLLGRIISNKLIDFYGLKMKHITVDEILDNGEEWYNNLLKPFLCNKDVWGLNDDFGLLEIFYLISHEQIKKGETKDIYDDLLKNSLSYFFNIDTKDIKMVEMGTDINIVIGENPLSPTLFIDSNRFEELRKIILLEYNDGKEIHKSDLEKENKEKTSKDKVYAERLKHFYEGKRKYENNKKNGSGKINKTARICNVYDTIVNWVYGGDYNKGLDKTLYQLYSTYNFKNAESNYKYVLNISSSGMATSDLKITPLPEQTAK
jgi:hypothetical protein